MNDVEHSAPRPSRKPLLARLQARTLLAIEGLAPALGTLASGRAHVVYAQPSPARDAFFWQTAAVALRGPASVLSTRDADGIAKVLREHGLDIDVNRALHSRANLCALRAQPGRDGIDALIDALQALTDQCGARGTMFLIEGAEAFFSWQDAVSLASQGVRLNDWCAKERCGVLLVVAPPPLAPGQSPPDLQAFHGRFAGAAQLSQQQGQYTWEVAFWRDKQSVVAGEVLRLRFAPHEQRLMVASDTYSDQIEEAGMLAPDEDRVIVSRDAVLRERFVPENWRIVDSNEAAVATASQSVAATVILHYSGSRDLELLASQVHRLRRSAGRALKIVIREDREAMRQHYELLMLNLGANAVVAQRTPFARMQAMIDALQGQVFSRPILADYHSALSAVLTTSATGYVTPDTFLSLVRDAVDRSRLIRLPHVLLQLPLLPEVAHIDALRACHMNRAGDLCTAGSDSVYAFFFACRLDDVDAVCARVFQRPMADMFQGDLRSGDNESIAATLSELEADIQAYPPPDYTRWLAQEPSSHTEPSDAPTEACPTTPAPVQTLPLIAPRRAQGGGGPRALPRHHPVPLKPLR
ncbi:cellulose biosynthesis protein BcsE [Cupriavidus metallidurans]|uniref:Cellulose biosynthesis protein BcsE n=1 Tax=Cupriavidus metallidurans (strain ATCC 43123 / DSM 2839 / NBRC 102507 / CH34) TaxID=266264 RepID=Q1LL44_CUPMC|nr:cellulose biosynthesis protein BcsE [Cupriavidus metallidurans]ABF09132.1 probable protease involved in cellulose biosynthesis [Cupriavidus metallidurans CH34]QGS29983.1 cellulose biosynthesis protein BcsE [Cupriavidus metallidurans]